MNHRDRPVARVVLIDPLDRVLLFDTQLAYTRVWMMPGGGVKPGETFEEAAHRELWEEVGLREAVLGPCVWTVRFAFVFDDTVVHQAERYFLARTTAVEPSDANLEANERSEMLGHRWWSVSEIDASSEDFRPCELGRLLRATLEGGTSGEPFDAVVERCARVV